MITAIFWQMTRFFNKAFVDIDYKFNKSVEDNFLINEAQELIGLVFIRFWLCHNWIIFYSWLDFFVIGGENEIYNSYVHCI